MTVNQPLEGMPLNRLSGFAITASSATTFSGDSTAASDAIQLTRLGGVLNAYQTDARQSSTRVDRLLPMVRSREYCVGALELSRRLTNEMLQKQ
jgi:hypothetical protein